MLLILHFISLKPRFLKYGLKPSDGNIDII